MWVSRAAAWRGELGGFSRRFLILSSTFFKFCLISWWSPPQIWDGGTTHLSSPASTLHGSGLGKPSKIWVQIPLFFFFSFYSSCPVIHEKCSKMNGKMNCRRFPQMLFSCIFSCFIQDTGIILCPFTSFTCCCYSLVFLLTLPWATRRIARWIPWNGAGLGWVGGITTALPEGCVSPESFSWKSPLRWLSPALWLAPWGCFDPREVLPPTQNIKNIFLKN